MSTPTNIASTNWSGAVMTAASGESFGTLSAQWQVPTAAQVPIKGVSTSDLAEWIGIDGYESADVCQAGVLETVQTSANGQTTISCSAFDEWYPGVSNTIPASSFQVSPGNTIEVTVETTGAGATEATFIFDNETTGQIYDASLTAPRGTRLRGNSAEVVVETPEWISGNRVSQPLLSDFLNSPIAFQDVSATYPGGLAASLSPAQSIGMWTDDVPGSHGSYVQEAYGSIQPTSDSVTVTEDDYWPAPSSPVRKLFGRHRGDRDGGTLATPKGAAWGNSEAAHSANAALLTQHMAANFSGSGVGDGKAPLADPVIADHLQLAHPHAWR
jgi:Peptidase A4 family